METANLLKLYSEIFKTFSININHNNSYNNKYDLDLSKFPLLLRLLILPAIFPFLLRKYKSFWYLSRASFLISNDGRSWEYSILKKNRTILATFFFGDDIRSISLSRDQATRLDFDHHSFYLDQNINDRMIEINDQKSLNYSKAADLYSDYIFSLPVDQISHIKRSVYPFPLPTQRNKFLINQSKWKNLSTINVLHCPSHPVLKGTQLVNAAIKKLKVDGYKFNFTLLSGVSHAKVLDALDNTHYVLNQFYCFAPGIFGIEAMEANCLVFNSASSEIEPSLFDGSDVAWVTTYYWQIYENLKFYLDNPHLAQEQANLGTLWAKRHCSHESTKLYVESIMGKI